MTKQTRLFVAVASGILVVGLGTGLVAAYVGGFQNLTIIGGDGPDELAYVPADARFVAYANVRDIMSSEVRHKLTALQPGTTNPPEQFKEQTGIDIETDIEDRYGDDVTRDDGDEHQQQQCHSDGTQEERRRLALVDEVIHMRPAEVVPVGLRL